MLQHARDLVQGSWRYATGLRAYLSEPLDLETARSVVTSQLHNRDQAFLQVLKRGIYANASSPYRTLLLHAGFQFDDVVALIRQVGLEEALSRLHAAGVYVTLDEFKGRASVRRPGLEFPVNDSDFDNPLLTVHYESHTSGSRGGGTRVPIDFDSYRYEAAGYLLDLHATGNAERDLLMWRAAPPSSIGLRTVLLFVGAGMMPVKWFAPFKVDWNRQAIQGRALTLYTLLASRFFGHPLPRPAYRGREADVVPFLAAATRRGRPALVCCQPSGWVRLCRYAEEHAIDIAGTTFWGGGEPYTPGKAKAIARAGTTAAPNYGSAEAGNIGLACGQPLEPDDLHFMSDRLAVLKRPVQLPVGGSVNALFYSTLTTSAPKLMLNVESGDYAVLQERDCGCLWDELGFKLHIHQVRSYEKLTSQGVMFMDSMLHELLEDVLPARFGGGPIDYQLVEEEEDGIPRVSVLVSPRLGPVDEAAVVDIVLKSLSFADWSRRGANLWRQSDTLRVRRQEPYATTSGKVLPLHILNPSADSPPRD